MEDERFIDRTRWKGRNSEKDILRSEVWSLLEERSVSIGPVWSRIPNFIGADKAAQRLAELQIWKAAKVVKSNPDPPQIPVRLRALEDGKLVYVPVPELVKDYPFIELDPNKLQRNGIPFEEVVEKHRFAKKKTDQKIFSPSETKPDVVQWLRAMRYYPHHV